MRKLYLTMLVISFFTSYYAFSQCGKNLIANSAFESGNTGFTSGYSYYPGSGILASGHYEVSSIPHHPCFSGPDHSAFGSNLALYVNSATTGNVTIWEQSVVVSEGTNYYFSFWIHSQCGNFNPVDISILINGVEAGRYSPSTNDVWEYYSFTWIANSSAATIRIVNNKILEDGNDLGLDDIFFAPVLACPGDVSIEVDGPINPGQNWNDTAFWRSKGLTAEKNAHGIPDKHTSVKFNGPDKANPPVINISEKGIDVKKLEIPNKSVILKVDEDKELSIYQKIATTQGTLEANGKLRFKENDIEADVNDLIRQLFLEMGVDKKLTLFSNLTVTDKLVLTSILELLGGKELQTAGGLDLYHQKLQGDSKVVLNGAGDQQVKGNGKLNNMEIKKPAGKVKLDDDDLHINNGGMGGPAVFKTNADVKSSTGKKVKFEDPKEVVIKAGGKIDNVEADTKKLTLEDDLVVLLTLYLTLAEEIDGFGKKVVAKGDVVVESPKMRGNAKVEISGDQDQRISGGGKMHDVIIDKTNGEVKLQGDLNIAKDKPGEKASLISNKPIKSEIAGKGVKLSDKEGVQVKVTGKIDKVSVSSPLIELLEDLEMGDLDISGLLPVDLQSSLLSTLRMQVMGNFSASTPFTGNVPVSMEGGANSTIKTNQPGTMPMGKIVVNKEAGSEVKVESDISPSSLDVLAGILKLGGVSIQTIMTAREAIITGIGTLVGKLTMLQNDVSNKLSPGNSPGIITINGDLDVSGTEFALEINGNEPGISYDQIQVSGNVIIGENVTLNIQAGPVIPSFNYVLVRNDGNNPVSGTFVDLPPYIWVNFGGKVFMIDYQGGDGNDIVLTYDIDSPEIVCPQDITVSCEQSTLPVYTGYPTVTDLTQTYVSYEDAPVTPGLCKSYSFIRLWKVRDALNNTSTCQQNITVVDQTPPTFTRPSDIIISSGANCSINLSPSVTGDVTNEQDNCANGLQATYYDHGVWAICPGKAVILRTWQLVDHCGNHAADQVQRIDVIDNTAPSFTRPADKTILFNSTCGYDASPSETGDVTDESDNCSWNLDATYTDQVDQCGNKLIITRTWNLIDGCGNAAAAQIQTISVTDNTTNYIIYAKTEVSFGEYNTIKGDVGVTAANGKASFKKFDVLDPYKVFAKTITVQSPSSVNNRFSIPATGGPAPLFVEYNGTGGVGNLTVSSNGTVIGNYKNLTIKKGLTVTITGNDFGKLKIEEGAKVTFTSQAIHLEELVVGKGKKNQSTTDLYFTGCTGISVKNKVTIEEDCKINVAGPKLTFYLGDTMPDEEKFTVKGDGTKVTANIIILKGKIHVTGGTDQCIMKGLFMVDKLQSDGKNISWEKNECENVDRSITSRGGMEEKSNPGSSLTELNTGKLQVFPNPSNGQFKLLVPATGHMKFEITIYNNNGELVQKRSVNGNENAQLLEFNLSNVSNGLYFIRVVVGDLRLQTKLVIER